MHALATICSIRKLSVVLAALALAACGQGDGPESIANEAVPPLPPSGGDGAFDSGLLLNGDFETGVQPWIGNAANVVDDGGNFVNFANVAVAGQPFDVNLSQVVAITEGEAYTLTFKARTNGTRTVVAGIGLNEAPFTNVFETVNLTDDWQTFELEFTATGFGGANSRVLFDMGADTGLVLIDNVSLFLEGDDGVGGGPIDPDTALYRTEGEADLVLDVDYEQTEFDSGSVSDRFYADDEAFSPALSVSSGTGYGANIAQVGFIGFPAGFLTNYETVDFKVKGTPNFVIFVKLFDGVDALRLNLTSSSYSAALGDGWFQVSIPVARFTGAGEATGIVFESDDSAAMQFRMLLTDVGFSGIGDRVPADPGIIPDVTLYDRDGTPDLAIGVDYTEILAFGSGAVLVNDFSGDLDFSPAWSVTTGFGYGIWNAQLAYVGFAPGFAATYETLDFKVKNLGGDTIRVKFLSDPNPPYVVIDVTSSGYSTALGNGWYQVSVPVGDFEGVAAATGLLFETVDPAPAESFTYLLTDIGFSGTVTGADPGIVPDVVIYSSSAPADLEIGVDYIGYDRFGSGSEFEDNYTADPDFSPAFAVTTGNGYGVQVGQFAIVGFAPGFAASYETLDFKAKGLNNDLIRVKFLDGGDYLDVLLSGSAFSTDLGNGWYQVSIPLASFTGVDTATALLFETDNTAAEAFTFLLTDFGFSGSSGAANHPDSIIPEAVLFATDPNVPVDFVFGVDYSGFDTFGSGSVYNLLFADDPDFNPAYSVTSGAGYGANIAQFAIAGFAPGFAAGYATLEFKIKGMPGDLIRVKFLDAGDYVDIDLTTSEYSKPLGNGWYQVSIPLSLFTGVDTATALLFESNNTAPAQFTFLLTDIGFSGTSGGGGPGGGELLTNGDFEASAVDKAPWINAGGVATNNFYTVDAVDGGNVFDTNLSQVLDITQGADYVLSFRARASVARNIVAGIGLNVGPFTAATESVPLTTEWQTFSYNLTAVADIGTAESRVLFDMGTVASTVNIDDVSLALASAPGVELLTNGDFEASAADKAPWVNAGGVATNNFYTVDAADGGNVFDTNLSQVLDITQDADYVLTFRARASVARDIVAGIGLNVGPFTAVTVNVPLTTEWQTFSYPLTATGFGGADSRVLFDMGTVASTVNIDDVSLTLADGGGGGPGAGDIAVNGGFETGDLSNWTLFPASADPNEQTVVTTNPRAGTYAGRLNNTTPGTASIIKQANLMPVAIGQTATVSFSARGSFGVGGVAFAEFFTELGGGGASSAQILGGGPLALDADPNVWADFEFVIPISADVSGGVTLQLTATTGGAGSFADVYYDDISIVIN